MRLFTWLGSTTQTIILGRRVPKQSFWKFKTPIAKGGFWGEEYLDRAKSNLKSHEVCSAGEDRTKFTDKNDPIKPVKKNYSFVQEVPNYTKVIEAENIRSQVNHSEFTR